MHQDKLSEGVQKQHDGPEKNGSLSTTQAETDSGLPLNPEQDASQAEEDKDKTKLLLERLKTLEVTTSPLSLSIELVSCLPLFSPLYTSFTLPATPGFPLWPACLPVVRVLAQLCLKA